MEFVEKEGKGGGYPNLFSPSTSHEYVIPIFNHSSTFYTVLNDDECAKAACSYCDVPKMTNLRDYMSTYVALEPKTAYDAVSGCQEDIWYQCIKNNAGKIIAVTSDDCPPVT